ncbi:hypothetical protein H6P81_013999 [Aristolochia fimbriata]|uniref:Large ribosomal subunit protein uL1c n=1 Tax=Aristolochia fimbriata TaxID=158543 RepID=A0AAV7EJL3_ARIFI|nr:hypothetical protein H6P81_013999 [Aristolochia fimbriata]
MAALEIFLSQSRRICKPSCSQVSLLLRLSSSGSLFSGTGSCSRSIANLCRRYSSTGCSRSFSTSSSGAESETRSVASSKEPAVTPSIKPVSYAARPVDPSSVEETESSPSVQRTPRRQRGPDQAVSRTPEASSEPAGVSEPRSFTREDIRYVKDTPSISPVSYPARVAPLPEDRVSEGASAEASREQEKRENEQLERERRKIEAQARISRALKGEDENVPFPTLIKVEKKKQKTVLDLQEAIQEVKANAKRNFDETVEAHVNLGVDPRRGDQMVRGATTLPHGTGKSVRVAVFAEGKTAEEAKAAGADVVGGDDLIEEIKNGGGKLNFDKCISTPTFMPRLGKIARILGPRGMMPNPKLGSVTSDVATAVKEAKRGRVDFKIDKTAIVHAGLGKVSFSDEALRENIGAFVNALLLAKPVGLKKTSKYAGYVNNFTLSSTMGPGFPVSIQSLSIAADQYNRQQQLK